VAVSIFSWIDQNHRLSKDHETLTTASEAFVHVAMIHRMRGDWRAQEALQTVSNDAGQRVCFNGRTHPRKGKPVERRGRKVTGLSSAAAAGPPKGDLS
jgi:hypothetical protein